VSWLRSGLAGVARSFADIPGDVSAASSAKYRTCATMAGR
jgi:hypothetical protein